MPLWERRARAQPSVHGLTRDGFYEKEAQSTLGGRFERPLIDAQCERALQVIPYRNRGPRLVHMTRGTGAQEERRHFHCEPFGSLWALPTERRRRYQFKTGSGDCAATLARLGRESVPNPTPDERAFANNSAGRLRGRTPLRGEPVVVEYGRFSRFIPRAGGVSLR